jgi:hypothetical protein
VTKDQFTLGGSRRLFRPCGGAPKTFQGSPPTKSTTAAVPLNYFKRGTCPLNRHIGGAPSTTFRGTRLPNSNFMAVTLNYLKRGTSLLKSVHRRCPQTTSGDTSYQTPTLWRCLSTNLEAPAHQRTPTEVPPQNSHRGHLPTKVNHDCVAHKRLWGAAASFLRRCLPKLPQTSTAVLLNFLREGPATKAKYSKAIITNSFTSAKLHLPSSRALHPNNAIQQTIILLLQRAACCRSGSNHLR